MSPDGESRAVASGRHHFAGIFRKFISRSRHAKLSRTVRPWPSPSSCHPSPPAADSALPVPPPPSSPPWFQRSCSLQIESQAEIRELLKILYRLKNKYENIKMPVCDFEKFKIRDWQNRRSGFSPYILLRLARFFFYCQNIIQIFPAIFSMVNQKTGMKDIVSDKHIFVIDREIL